MTECKNPEIGRMIGRYEFDLLTPDEKAQFEAHVLECDACFQELHAFSPAVRTIKKHIRAFRKAVQEEKPRFRLFNVLIPQSIVRYAVAASILIVVAVVAIHMKDALFGPSVSDEMIASHEAPQLLTPHDPDVQALKGDMEIAPSAVRKILIGSMRVRVNQDEGTLELMWNPVAGVDAYALCWIDAVSQDTVFSSTEIKNPPFQFSLSRITMDHPYIWRLSGFSDGKRLVDVQKKIRLK